MASSFVFGHRAYLFRERTATFRCEVWILTLSGWLHVTAFVLAQKVATVPGGRETWTHRGSGEASTHIIEC